jgi:phosphomannomutase
MRETNGIFGGEVTGHYYFRDNFYADNGFIPALLMLELMSKKNQSLHELLKPLAQKYFISGEINTKLSSMREVPPKLVAIGARYADGKQYGSMGCRSSTPTGISTSGRGTPSRCSA